MGKGRMILQRLADGADLSAEPLPGQPIVEIAGDRRVLIENHFGVKEYSREKIGANSVVLQPVPEYATAAGVPARIVGKDKEAKPAFEMNQYFIDDDINLNI